jgi:LPS-assembly lipoprotein
MTRPLTRRAALAGAAGLLSGCGFHPLYATSAGGGPSSAQAELAAVFVPVIPEHTGQFLRQALQQRLEGAGSGVAKRYTLNAGYAIASDALAIQPDTTASRVRLIGTAPWTLMTVGLTPKPLTTGQGTVVDGYNIIGQQYFAAQIENETVTRRMAETLADQIVTQLAVYFRRQALGAAG